MLWWQSVLSKAPVGLLQIVFMRFRKINPSVIVNNRITAVKAGINIDTDLLGKSLHVWWSRGPRGQCLGCRQ